MFLNLIGRYLVFSHSHRDLDTNNSPHRSQTMNVVCKLRGRGERWIGGGDLSRRGGGGGYVDVLSWLQYKVRLNLRADDSRRQWIS